MFFAGDLCRAVNETSELSFGSSLVFSLPLSWAIPITALEAFSSSIIGHLVSFYLVELYFEFGHDAFRCLFPISAQYPVV